MPASPTSTRSFVRIVPSSEVAMQLLSSGEIDVMWNNTEADIPQLAKMTGVKITEPGADRRRAHVP